MSDDMIRLRIRGPSGQTTITLPSTSTWGDLKRAITAATLVPSFDLKSGFPPRPLGSPSLEDDIPLTALDTPLHGEQLTVIPLGGASPPGPSPSSTVWPAPPTTPRSSTNPTGALPPTRQSATTTTSSSFSSSDDLPTVPVPALSGTLTLRVMPDDNSCLFRALSSALLTSSHDGGLQLRSLVARRITDDGGRTYSAAVLGRPVGEYCDWILRPDSWGGGIELSVLSLEFAVEVCSVDVQGLRVDRFNEGCGRRVVLVYSGIHYDVVAVTPYGQGPEADQKVFDVLRLPEGEEDGGVLEASRELCRELQRRHYYTDTKGFQVSCNVCGWSGKGERGATAHARETGHMDFGEA